MTFSDRAVEAAKKAAPKFWRQTSDFDKHMAKCLTAALAVDGPALQGWRTIDSAPKDGTCILLCAIDDTFHEVCTGWWDSEWRDYGDIGCNGQCDYHPTHWQPLPAPPLTAASDGEVG